MAAMAPSVIEAAAFRWVLAAPGNRSCTQIRSALQSSSVARARTLHAQQVTLAAQGKGVMRCSYGKRLIARALEEGFGSSAGAGGDSVVSEVALLEDEPETPGVGVATKTRKPSPLQKGGTLDGKQAAGKDPGSASLKDSGGAAESGHRFEDRRWLNGTWDLPQFTKSGKVDWDAVIDAEVKRRKWLEDNPEASSNSDPVLFETSTVPWWAWVKRFHLPEAELLNGRAAMIGFFAGYVVDSLTGVGLVDQTNSFLGKVLLFISVVSILLIRKTADVENLKGLVKESTFYDKQWQAAWVKDAEKDAEKDENSNIKL